MAWRIRFDFDCQGDPPSVRICNESGTEYAEIFEEPLLYGKPFDDTGPYSWSEQDWSPGPFAAHVLDLLNRHPLK